MLNASLIQLEYASRHWKSTFSYSTHWLWVPCVRASAPGCPWHLLPCRGSFCVVRASRVCGTRWPLWLGICLVPSLWPAACLSGVPCGPALVRLASSGPVALGAPVGFPVAVVPSPTPRAVAPGFTGWLRGARGGRPRTGLIVPAAGPCRGKGAGRAPRRTRWGPRDGVVPGRSLPVGSWAACAAVVRRVWTWSLTRPVSRTVRRSTVDSAGAPGLFRMDADTSPFASEDATPGSRVCVCGCSSWPDRACRPPGRVVVRLTFSCGRSGCASCLLGSLRAWVALFEVVVWFCPFFSLFFFLFAVLLSPAFRVFRPGVPWAWASSGPPLPSPFFFLRLLSLAFRGSQPGVAWALALCGPPAWPFSLPFFSFSIFFFFPPPLPPLPFLFFFLFFVFSFPFSASAFFFLLPCRGVPVVRFSGWFVRPGLGGVLVCVAVSLGAPLLCPFCVCCCLLRCGVMVCFVLCLVLCGVPVLGLVLAPRCCPLLPSPGPLSWPVVVFCPGVRCCVVLVCRLSCGVRCGAVLFRLRWLVLCGVACGCWLFAAGSGLALLALVSRWRVLSRVLLPGRVACCLAVCCGLSWCPPFLCCVLCSVVLCCPVVQCCGPLLSLFLCWWCWFVSFLCVCGAMLRCASCCSVPVRSALLLVPRAVACRCVLSCVPGRSAVWWCCSGLSWCLAVPCFVLWSPAPCAVSCGAVLPCSVALAGCAVRLSALLVFVSPFVLFSFAKNPCCFSVPLKQTNKQKSKCFSLQN